MAVAFNARQDPDSWEDRTGPLDTDGGTQAVAVTGDVFHTLRAEGFDASEDGTGRGAGAVAVPYGLDEEQNPTRDFFGTLKARSKGGGFEGTVAIPDVQVGMLAIRGRDDGTGRGAGAVAVPYGVAESPDFAHCLSSGASKADEHESTTYVRTAMQVRRLTPTECERLQGFPDGHTRIPWPVVRDVGIHQCRKRVVRATVRTPAGSYFVATNHLSMDPGVCPRAEYPTGQGYDLCASVCGQQAHAEIRALVLAGKKAKGATLYVEGHTYACEDCLHAARNAGIVEVVLGPPPTESCPDGPRYKALGNSMAVPVMRWIGRRIDAALRECQP